MLWGLSKQNWNDINPPPFHYEYDYDWTNSNNWRFNLFYPTINWLFHINFSIIEMFSNCTDTTYNNLSGQLWFFQVYLHNPTYIWEETKMIAIMFTQESVILVLITNNSQQIFIKYPCMTVCILDKAQSL